MNIIVISIDLITVPILKVQIIYFHQSTVLNLSNFLIQQPLVSLVTNKIILLRLSV